MGEPSGHPIGNGQSINDCTAKAMKSRDALQSNVFTRFRKPRENRTRWYILFAAAVLVTSLAVVAITLAIYFGTGKDNVNSDEGQVETIRLGPDAQDSTDSPSTKGPFITKLTSHYPSSTSKKATSQGISSDDTYTKSATSHVHKQTTKSRSSESTSASQTTKSSHRSTTETRTTSLSSHTSATIADDQTTKVTQSTQGSTETVTEYPLRPTLTVQTNNIVLPYSKAVLSVSCVTMYARQWREMRIYRQMEGDSIVSLVVVKSYMGSPNVEINANFTSEISYKEDALLVTIHSKEVDCSYLGNYTCLLVLPEETYKNTTQVQALNKKESKPKLTISTSVVEDNTATITCSMELIEPNATITYKFRPPGLDKYFNLSLSPNITRTWTGCSLLIESTLTMVSKMHDNGSVFMCEVTTYRNNAITTYVSEAEFNVIPKTFCNDKNAYAIYPHPYETCNSVVYCYMNSPQVYKINCGAGYCYDTTKTNCVKVGYTSVPTTTPTANATVVETQTTGLPSDSKGT
ncbi:uncharacterized protein LOC133182304 isoform X2 [Saccostrea echinata]|uniref:uncharacterized protein LOC133182304 isoform X2 n=1 Tax=Saccostrea echinata TaxID=191078 RepID=UPI002A82D641|nr:uncharacterized protein LOC133182304 isoform X2 [Saccostrea echinata]